MINENRNDFVHFTTNNKLKTGANSIDNRFKILSNVITFEMLHWSKDRFKTFCKKTFILNCLNPSPLISGQIPMIC